MSSGDEESVSSGDEGASILKQKGKELFLKIEVDMDFEALKEQFLSIRGENELVSSLYISEIEGSFRPPSINQKNEQGLVSLLQFFFEKEPKIASVFIASRIPLKTLYTILLCAKELEELDINEGLIFSYKEEYEDLLKSMPAGHNCMVKRFGFTNYDVDDDQLYPGMVASLVIKACPNIESLDAGGEKDNLNWRLLLSPKHLKEIFVYDQCLPLFNALKKSKPKKLEKLTIQKDPDQAECEAIARFMSSGGSNVSLKELNLEFQRLNSLEDPDEALLPIVNALATNSALRVFSLSRDPNSYPEGKEDDHCWNLSDDLAEDLLESIQRNPRITEVDVPYESPHSETVQSINTYLSVHRHHEILREDDNTTANKLLWVHALCLSRDNLDYLFVMLQTDPSFIASDHRCKRKPKKKRALANAAAGKRASRRRKCKNSTLAKSLVRSGNGVDGGG